MGAFSLASVLGVPAGLELSRVFGWRAPFFAVAALGLLLTVSAIWLMPSMRQHLNRPRRSDQGELLDSVTGLSLLNTALIMGGVFAVVPNISAYVQHNMGYPRDRIGLLYLVGVRRELHRHAHRGQTRGPAGRNAHGIARHGAARGGAADAFVYHLPWRPVLFIFTIFMLSGSVRMVPMQTLRPGVPLP
jgi:MFS family permease